MNASIDSTSPIFSKFMQWRKQSEAFRKVFKEINEEHNLKKFGFNKEEFDLRVQALTLIS